MEDPYMLTLEINEENLRKLEGFTFVLEFQQKFLKILKLIKEFDEDFRGF